MSQEHGTGRENQSCVLGADEIAAKEAQSSQAALDEEKSKWLKSQKKQAYGFRQKAQKCICLDDMAAKHGITTRTIFREVLTKQRNNSKGCMTLPVTIAFVALYAFSARLHEDITNVFLLESALKNTFTGGMESLSTLADVWSWLSSGAPQPLEPGTDVVNTFFSQVDEYGEPLPPEDWSRVLWYSQVQGAVILKQYRDKSGDFGKVMKTNLSSYAMIANASNEGFVPQSEINNVEGQPKQKKASGLPKMNMNFGGRRLANLLLPEIADSLPSTEVPDSQLFEFKLYPTMSIQEVNARMEYLKHRQWLDRHTQMLVVQALVLNSELGRPRLEEVMLKISFSRGGELYWQIQLECLFLAVWPDGIMSKGADFVWLFLLFVTLGLELRTIYVGIYEEKLWSHVSNPATPYEWFIMGLGIANFMCLGMMTVHVTDLDKTLKGVRDLTPSSLPKLREEASVELYKSSEKMIVFMGQYRTLVCWYNILLIFRFFVAFRVQPRLAVVTNTLIAVTEDLLHFLFVLTPTFVAYMIAGNILFGRRLEMFCSIRMATGSLFRMLYENEFPWDDLSQEHFLTAALYVWSYLLIVVLLMLNLVLAIILDTYNEVRTNTDSADTIFVFLELVAKRVYNCRHWIPNRKLEGILSEMDEQTTITLEDMAEIYPHMPQDQSEMVFRACIDEMNWQAKSDLNRGNLLKISASVKLLNDEACQSIFDLAAQKAGIKRQLSSSRLPERLSSKERLSDVQSEADALHLALRQRGNSRPFPGMQASPGGYFPPLLDPAMVPEELGKVTFVPEWLDEVRRNSLQLSTWMAALRWQFEGLQWKFQEVHRMEEDASNYSSRQGSVVDDTKTKRASSDSDELDSHTSWTGPLRTKGGNWLL